MRADMLGYDDELLINTSAGIVSAHVEMLQEAPLCARVYDLTVDDQHEFFAGDVLVSNCIDAVRYGMEGARRAQKANKPAAPVIQRTFVAPSDGWML